MMYIQPPSALKATSVGSYAVGIKPMLWNACRPPSGITAMELEPALTAYSVVLAGLMVTAVGAAPVVFAGKWRYSRSEEHTSELQSQSNLVCRLLLAKNNTLYEMEIALTRAFEHDPSSGPSAPWLADALFRHLLIDVSGNTHRAESSIDKLFDCLNAH